MITVKKISVNELPELVKMSYEGDNALFEKYFGSQNTFMGCVNSQLAMIYEMANYKRLSYYKVVYQKKAIGYFVTFDNILYSFAINIKYRKRDILLNWWDRLKSPLNKGFVCYLYKHNERAINFLLNNGMKVLEENQELNTVALINYK